MINTDELEKVFTSCPFTKEEVANGTPENLVKVEGITRTFGLHPERLEATRETVRGWLAQLPVQFFKGTGDGYSFLSASFLNNGEQWGEQHSAELLFSLGMGLGFVKLLLPREMWHVLPEGMPYYQIDLGT